jgi:hypothetical protein
MPLMLSRTATVISLAQLAGEPSPDGRATPGGGSPGAGLPSPIKGALSTPEKEVREVATGQSLLPLYAFPALDGFQVKRVRSFGSFQDLAAAGNPGAGPAVPDVDDRCAVVWRCANSLEPGTGCSDDQHCVPVAACCVL